MFQLLIAFFLIASFNDKATENKRSANIQVKEQYKAFANSEGNTEKETMILAQIDSIANEEVKQYIDEDYSSMIDYYNLSVDDYDDFTNWSQKMFGRCCTKADLAYAEVLRLKISINIANNRYPASNLPDFKYKRGI